MPTKKSNRKNAETATKTAKSKTTTLSPSMLDAALVSLRAALPAVPTAEERRRELLARVAGVVAAGLITAPKPSIALATGVATVAVDIAEEILKRVGISTASPASLNAADAAVDAAHVADVHSKILGFLMGEWTRKNERQLIRVDLLYAPGQGFRDEELRRWDRADEPEFFAEYANIEKLVAQIIDISEGEADAKPPGKHRFIVRTHQHMGTKPSMSFALYPRFFGAAS